MISVTVRRRCRWVEKVGDGEGQAKKAVVHVVVGRRERREGEGGKRWSKPGDVVVVEKSQALGLWAFFFEGGG